MLSIPTVALEVEGQGNHGGSIPAQRQRKGPLEGAGLKGGLIRGDTIGSSPLIKECA